MDRGLRVGFLASHPIQYLSPLFRELDTRVDLHVFYAHNPNPKQQADAGFDVEFEWDTDLLSGYEYTFLQNEAANPDAREGNFFGCDTPEIYDRISEGHFDAFIVNGWYLKSFWQAVWACRRAEIPVFARGDSQLHTPRSWWKQAVKEVGHRALLRVFDGFLSVGEQFDEYLRHYGVPEERIYRAPHAVDNAWFFERAQRATEDKARQELRTELEVDPETTILLFVGKFIPVKRAGDLLKALKVLEDKEDVCAVYVGSGPLEDELAREAERLDVPAHFVGFKNQSALPPYYALADALVLPSESETWGLVVNEAMACGTPAIVSEAVGCRPDLIVDGKTGYSFPVGDVNALSEVVKRLIADNESGHDFEAAVREHIDQYSIEAAAEGIVSAMHTVAHSKTVAR
ncbi:glycosyltransferase family 4 protein [Salinibacter sp.]|uniref:glycosyltransferase family 4 protein n=1 Tax=Salinibacter sp. TaxID=2065818 RepID=UPI0021E70BBC|nr:glycosyltransferase family 4 protein [Salinibacter sp.]